MPENETPSETGFETKPVGTPSLDPATKDQIAVKSVPSAPETPLSGASQSSIFRGNKLYIIAGLIGAVIIALVFFFMTRGGEEVKEANVTMEIDMPSEIPGNAESIIKIKVENKDSESLVKPELEVVYPEGFRYVTSTPEAKNITGNLFAFGDIAPGQAPTLLIKVRAEGGIGESQKLKAKLRYRFKNFSSEFAKEAEKTAVVIASGVQLNLDGPNRTNNSELITYTLTYVNNADSEFKNARIEFNYPAGFTFAGGSPEPSVGKNIWTLPQVPPDYKGTITVSGSFKSATPGESQTITAKFLSADSGGSFRAQAESSFITAIESLPLLVTHELTQNSDKPIVSPGDDVTYRVRYQNNATTAARGVNIIVSLSSKAIDVNSIRAEGAQISGSTISWNASSIPNLEIVNPNESGEFTFTFEVNNPPVKDSSTNIDIKSSIKIKSNEYEQFLPGNELRVKIRSLAEVFTGLKYSSGALPPRVGNDTVYAVSISAKNLTNNLDNCTLTGFIAVNPAGFETSSMAPALEASRTTFDPKTGKITWNIGQLRAHTGDFSQSRTLNFNLKINPSASQAGDEVLLVKSITASCTDSFTEEDVGLSTEDITTEDIDDNGGNSGRVED